MEDSKLINFVYTLASEGISEHWFQKGVSPDWYTYVVKLPEKLKITYLIGVLNFQVTNGGLNQYFINGYGQFIYETIECLQKIGLDQMAKLLKQAINEVNKENLSPAKFRKMLVNGKILRLYEDENLDDFLNDLDNRFDTLNLEMLDKLAEYLRNNVQ